MCVCVYRAFYLSGRPGTFANVSSRMIAPTAEAKETCRFDFYRQT